MTDAMDRAVALTDRDFLCIALDHLAQAKIARGPLTEDLHVFIATTVLNQLDERLKVRST